MIKIRFAAIEDKPAIISFLKKHWSEKSILVRSGKIFDFQYIFEGKCGFVLAIDDETGEIYGIKGYFPFNSLPEPDVAAALAIVLQGVRPMLGMEIERFLEKETHSRWLCSTGLNPNTSVRVYQLFKKQYVVDKLRHYYRIADRNEYRVAVVDSKRILPVEETGCELVPLSTIDEYKTIFDATAYIHQRPYKDEQYIEHRYFKHPVYHYQLLGIREPHAAKVSAVIIARGIDCNDTKVLRIVDYLGDRSAIGRAGSAVGQLLEQEGYEYADFYCYGFGHEHMTAGGFVLRDENDPNVIPNYFEPFERRNVDVWFFSTGAENAAVCKADGDQDRPNILPEGFEE